MASARKPESSKTRTKKSLPSINSKTTKPASSSVVSTARKSSSTTTTNAKGKISNSLKSAKPKAVVAKPLDKDNLGLFNDEDFEEMTKNGHLEETFNKFWKGVTDGMDKYPFGPIPRNTPIDNKISEIQKRIKLNQVVLQSANERMRNINFQTERQSLNQWRHTSSFASGVEAGDRFKDMESLESEVEKLRQTIPERKLGLKAIPGVADFHRTMKSTLDILDKIQNKDEYGDYDKSYKDIKKEFEGIKNPGVLQVSNEK